MNDRLARYTGWAATFCGIAGVLAMISLLLFFGLESSADSARPHFWGPVSDIAPIFQMASLLFVACALYFMQRSRDPRLTLISSLIGMIGMMGVMLLQFLLVINVIPFELEVGPVVLATAAVGVWLISVNLMIRRQGSLPSRLAWLGIATGAAFVLEPVMLSAAGGAVAWRVFMSNYLLLAVSAIVFLVSYVGFPVWAFWLGRVFLRTNAAVATPAVV